MSELTAYEQAQAKLRELAAKVEAGTPGPWRRNPDRWGPPGWEHDMAYLRVEAGEPHPSSGLGVRIFHTDGARLNDAEDVRHEGDVAKAVTAVNLLPGFVALCEGVLGRHTPQRAMGGVIYCLGGHALATRWSDCPDARAVFTALGVEVDA